MTQATIDLATFEALKDAAGADFVLELVDTFLVEAPAMIGDLRSALAANDADRFRRAAHSLKSNSMTFGALTLGAMARSLELGGIEPVQQAGGEPLDQLADEYARVARTLSELRNA
jgi:HPt (histidine-containing phosphotransfer) domain-containing protein